MSCIHNSPPWHVCVKAYGAVKCLYQFYPFLLLIFDKVPKTSEVGDQKTTETSVCSDENDDSTGFEVNGGIEHQTVLDPQPLTVMKAR